MTTIVLDIVMVLALAAAGTALVLRASPSAPPAPWAIESPAASGAGSAGEAAAPAASDYVIDDEGMPLFLPARTG